MQNPIQTLRLAYQEKSWSLVAEAFEALTGGPIAPLDELLPPVWGGKTEECPFDPDPDTDPPKPPQVKRPRGRPRKVKAASKQPQKVEVAAPLAALANGKPNRFIDDGSLDQKLRIALHPEKAAKLAGSVIEPRPPLSLVEVECVICHKTDRIPPAIAPKRIGEAQDGDDGKTLYRCNRCATNNRR